MYRELQAGSSFTNDGKPHNEQPSPKIDAGYWHTPARGFGYLTPAEALKYYNEVNTVTLGSTKRFLLEITQMSHTKNAIKGRGFANVFNLLVNDITYSPNTIPPEKKNIGMAVIDALNTTEQIDYAVQANDDKQGTLKKWADTMAGAVANSDGTVGLPIDYLLKIKILHNYTSDDVAKRDNIDPYITESIVRIVSSEITLSRESKNGITINFTQFDTCY